jgi:hypothetical protein
MNCKQENQEITITSELDDGKSMYIKGSTVLNEGIHFHYE